MLWMQKHYAKTDQSGSGLLCSRLLKRHSPQKAMTINVYSSIPTTPSSTASYRHNTIWYWNLCMPYLIRNSDNYHWHTCRFKYSKHFYSESLTSRELRWLEPDKSCSCYFIEVVFHYVVSPRITIENLETKVAAALSIPIPNHIMIWRT